MKMGGCDQLRLTVDACSARNYHKKVVGKFLW